MAICLVLLPAAAPVTGSVEDEACVDDDENAAAWKHKLLFNAKLNETTNTTKIMGCTVGKLQALCILRLIWGMVIGEWLSAELEWNEVGES